MLIQDMAGACEEIEKLKAVTQCKIIKNVGDFAYLITAKVGDTEATVKFQLSGTSLLLTYLLLELVGYCIRY